MHLRLLFLIIILLPGTASSQSASWEDYIWEACNIEDYDETEIAEINEHLWELDAHPLNINTATYDDFSRIPGMDIDRISDIMYYRDTFGYLRTMEELALIRSIDRPTRLFLSQLFYAGKPEKGPWYKGESLDSLLHHGRGSVLTTGSIPLYSRRGDDGKYLGDKYKYSIKVKGHFSDYIKYALTAAKDGGEPFFSNGNKSGFDYYSFYLNINNIARMKRLMLGRYRIKLGQGLILNNSFSLGKQYALPSLGSNTTAISGHSSRSDGHYLQGIATTFSLSKHIEATAFWSYRKIDATLNKDGTVSTILTSGYHRTETEMAKKNNTSELMSGGNISWKNGGWHAGISGVYTWYDRPLAPNASQLYRRYSPRGYQFWNASVDYGYLSRRITVAGETATGDCGDIATLNMATVLLPKDVQLTAVQRYYSYKYYALLAKSFSDGGHIQNESGIYLGLRMPLKHHLTLDAYTDYAYFPWARYRIPESSYSWDNNLALSLTRRIWSTQLRYRYRQRQDDSHYLRFSTSRTTDKLTLKAQADYRITVKEDGNSNGYMLSASATARPASLLSMSASAGYFNTDDYDTRMYIYERGTLESFTSSMLYGEGIRLSALVRADISRSWMLIGKIGFTNYLDRATISSGDRLIPHSYQTDIDLQVRYKF